MPTTTADATAAPTTVTIGSKRVKLAPLTQADLGELERWVREQWMRGWRDSLPKDASPADRAAEFREVMKLAQGVSLMSEDGMAIFQTQEAAVKLIYLSAVRADDTVTEAQVAEALREEATDAFDEDKVAELLEYVNVISGLVSEGKDAGKAAAR